MNAPVRPVAVPREQPRMVKPEGSDLCFTGENGIRLNHTWNLSGVCRLCGEKLPNFIPPKTNAPHT